MMASCRRPSKPSTTPKPPIARSSSPSTRWIKPAPIPRNVKEQLMAARRHRRRLWRRCHVRSLLGQNRHGHQRFARAILTKAEMMELKANPNRYAIGTVLEATSIKARAEGHLARPKRHPQCQRLCGRGFDLWQNPPDEQRIRPSRPRRRTPSTRSWSRAFPFLRG
jgi:hypothetical protein